MGFRALRSATRAPPLDHAALSRKGGRKAFKSVLLKLSSIYKLNSHRDISFLREFINKICALLFVQLFNQSLKLLAVFLRNKCVHHRHRLAEQSAQTVPAGDIRAHLLGYLLNRLDIELFGV